MMRLWGLMIGGFIVVCANASNPVGPTGHYIPDASARVWEDGRLYLYGSRDFTPGEYCSHSHDVLSTDDLVHWTVHTNVFASRGPGDGVPYNNTVLYAPDCVFKDGTYYLHYSQPDRAHPNGVATSSSPTGPFTNGVAIALGGYNEIDPAVFIDDDGQAYYTWGQFNAKIAKLNPNMIELDETTIVENLVTEKEHFFHEGGYIVKRNNIYYYVYSHMGRKNRPTCIGYATSSSPLGPYTYGGVIVDNDGCDPQTWNNHGSLVEFKGQWYVLYHRSTHNSKMMRRTCMEPIEFNADGSIDEVEMTSQGAGPPLDAFAQIDAGQACLLHGQVFIQSLETTNLMLTGSGAGDLACFKYIDFGDGAQSVSIRVRPGPTAGTISFILDQPWKAPFATLNVPSATHDEWVALSVPLQKPVRGERALWLRFNGAAQPLFEIDGLTFDKKK